MFFGKLSCLLAVSFFCVALGDNSLNETTTSKNKAKLGIVPELSHNVTASNQSKIIASGVKGSTINLNGSSTSISHLNTSVPPISKAVSPIHDTNVPVFSEGHSSVPVINDKTDEKTQLANSTTEAIEKPDKKSSVEKGRITPRKGVQYTEVDVTSVSTLKVIPKVSSTTPKLSTSVKYSKPKFTMVKGDKESKGRKSFIESPTTGKDYVFPLVLVILAIPLVFMIVKLIYKRGSEYTERRYYDRMYLIDASTENQSILSLCQGPLPLNKLTGRKSVRFSRSRLSRSSIGFSTQIRQSWRTTVSAASQRTGFAQSVVMAHPMESNRNANKIPAEFAN